MISEIVYFYYQETNYFYQKKEYGYHF